MIGRNELCPCGSGKKYKKCCLQKNKLIEITKNKTLYAKGLYENIENKINEYSRKEIFSKELNRCKDKFYISDNTDIKINKLFNTYFIYDFITSSNKRLINLFIDENQFTLNKIQKNILRGILKSNISLFNVEQTSITKSIVRDCFTNERITIEDIDLFNNFKSGENIIARLVNIQGMNILVDYCIGLSDENLHIIVDNIKSIYEKQNKDFKNIKEFLLNNSDLIYQFTQQILLNDASYIVKPLNVNNELNDNEEENIQKEDSIDICSILKNNIEEKYLQKSMDLWKSFTDMRKSIKGSENGWAAAIEYYIKKDAGETITQVEISKKYEISPRTLGKRYKELRAS